MVVHLRTEGEGLKEAMEEDLDGVMVEVTGDMAGKNKC